MLKTETYFMSTVFKLVFLLLCVLTAQHLNAAGISRDSVRLEERNGQHFVVHQVEEGETLYSLSRRYQSTIEGIKSSNELRNGGIDLGQFILIPISLPSEPEEVSVSDETPSSEITRKSHVVQAKETLYAISRKYDVTFEDIKSWNDLENNDLKIGMSLWVEPKQVEIPVPEPTDEDEIVPPEVKDEEERIIHVVEAGETLLSISRKYDTSLDSLTHWNNLENTSLQIGDSILIGRRETEEIFPPEPQTYLTNYGSKWWKEELEVDTLIHEEGVAGVIENIIETQKLLALHRNLPVGTELEVINLMNQRQVTVKIVGKLPDTGVNRNLMIRLTDVAYRQLGILDRRSRVEIVYPEL